MSRKIFVAKIRNQSDSSVEEGNIKTYFRRNYFTLRLFMPQLVTVKCQIAANDVQNDGRASLPTPHS